MIWKIWKGEHEYKNYGIKYIKSKIFLKKFQQRWFFMYYNRKKLFNKKVLPVCGVENFVFSEKFFTKGNPEMLHTTLQFYPEYGENETMQCIFFTQINDLITCYRIFISFRSYIYLVFSTEKTYFGTAWFLFVVVYSVNILSLFSDRFTGGVSGTLTPNVNTIKFFLI